LSPHGAAKAHARDDRRSIALFGGTFDPIHTGHIAVAQAAQRRFHLDAIYFIPSSHPPHKPQAELSPFIHRYTMAAVACADHPGFIPSLAEGPTGTGERVFYSIDTARRFRREHPDDHIYFIVGADQFLEVPTWKNYEALLDSCDFIVASRPGFRLDALRLVIPPEKLARPAGRTTGGPAGGATGGAAGHAAHESNKIVLRKSVIHLLTTVASHVSSTEIRERLAKKQSVRGLVPPRVEEYIQSQALYR
jgi:nicotinate-nucleotide adenylyltransferase